MKFTPTDVPGAHVRDNRGLLAAAEKRALIWLAHRLPAAVNSDHLSLAGLAAMAVAGLSFAAYAWIPPAAAAAAVVAALALNWFGDSLDGTVARVRDQQRPRYGFYVDHVIDLAGAACLMMGLALSGLMHPVVATMLLAAYLLVSAESYLATHVRGVFRMSSFGFGPTELRIVLAAGALRAAYDPLVAIGPLGSIRLFDLGGAVAVAGMTVAFLLAAFRTTRDLYEAEPLPVPVAAKRSA